MHILDCVLIGLLLLLGTNRVLKDIPRQILQLPRLLLFHLLCLENLHGENV